jgi:acetyl esterase
MPLEADAVRFLDQLNALHLPPVSELGAVAIRKAQWEEAATAAFATDDRFEMIDDVCINRETQLISRDVVRASAVRPLLSDDDQLTLRIYRPQGASGHICLYFHGGGWAIGSVVYFDSLVRQLALASGMTMVSVEYRLAPEFPFPAATIDAELAARWVCSQLLPGQKYAVAGDSAGANLATVLCQMLRDRGEHLPAAQVLFYPVTDANFESSSYEAYRAGYFLSREDMKWFWSLYQPQVAERSHPYASPLQGNLRGLPPARICVAGYDPLYDEGTLYADNLQVAGNDVEFVEYPGMIHGFVKRFTEFASGRQEIIAAGDYLRRKVQ